MIGPGYQQPVSRMHATLGMHNGRMGGFAMGGGGPGAAVGRILIIDKTDFSFDGRAGAGGGGVQSVPLAIGIDSSLWASGALIVRMHTHGSWPAGGGGSTGSATVVVENIALVPEDPSVVFQAATPIATSTAIVTGTVAPFLDVQQLTGAPIGPLLQVRLNFAQGTNNAGGAHTFSISVEFVGRPA